MVEYEISLRPSQLGFLSDNYDALFSEDEEIYNPPEMSPERLARMKEYCESVNEATRKMLEREIGPQYSSDPLLNKNLRIWEVHDAVRDFDMNSRSTSLIRSLYGVVGIERIRGGSWYHFHNFFVPEENWEATREALNNGGTFSREFPDEDLDVLRVVSERNQELRELGVRHRYPLFYISDISNLSGISMQDTEKGLINLIGVLGFCMEQEDKYWARRWFVPKAREGLIEELLS